MVMVFCEHGTNKFTCERCDPANNPGRALYRERAGTVARVQVSYAQRRKRLLGATVLDAETAQ